MNPGNCSVQRVLNYVCTEPNSFLFLFTFMFLSVTYNYINVSVLTILVFLNAIIAAHIQVFLEEYFLYLLSFPLLMSVYRNSFFAFDGKGATYVPISCSDLYRKLILGNNKKQFYIY